VLFILIGAGEVVKPCPAPRPAQGGAPESTQAVTFPQARGTTISRILDVYWPIRLKRAKILLSNAGQASGDPFRSQLPLARPGFGAIRAMAGRLCTVHGVAAAPFSPEVQ